MYYNKSRTCIRPEPVPALLVRIIIKVYSKPGISNWFNQAEHPILSNVQHAKHLPASWDTLSKLAKLPNDVLITKLKDGSIHPKLERKDVRAMQPDAKDRPKAATREELIAAIQQDPLANQRDAAEALGVSLGVYQRTRNELIGSGQIKGGLSAPAVDDPQMQRDEMRCSYVNFLQTLTKEEQVEEIKKIIRRELGWTTKEVSSLYPAPIKVKFK